MLFASRNDLLTQLDYVGDPGNVVIEKTVRFTGLNDAGQERHERLAGHLAGAQ